MNIIFQAEMKRRGIELYFSPSKCFLVERYIKEFKIYLHRFIEETGSKEYLPHLQVIVATLNFRPHRMLDGISPANAKLPHFKNRVLNATIKNTRRKKVKAKYKVGQKVRLVEMGHAFSRSFTPNFTREIFKIKSVFQRMPLPGYKVEALDGGEVVGTIWQFELSPVDYTP